HRKDFQMYAAMVPAKEVGGDFFDYFLLDEDHLGFLIGHVSGKGIPAALFMAVARTLLRSTADNQKRPGDCFTYMNGTLAEGNTGMFVTLFYGVLNTRTGELVFANAGHNPPYIFSADGTFRKLSDNSGPILGILPGHQYETLATRIGAGEGILLYTDGVTEAFDKTDEFFGEERLERYLAGHASGEVQRMVLGLHSDLQEFAKGVPQA